MRHAEKGYSLERYSLHACSVTALTRASRRCSLSIGARRRNGCSAPATPSRHKVASPPTLPPCLGVARFTCESLRTTLVPARPLPQE
eukprot:3630241-Pleurochrysis_carterae.AAC.3